MNLCRITLPEVRNKRTVKSSALLFLVFRVRNMKGKSFLLSGLKIAAQIGIREGVLSSSMLTLLFENLVCSS